MSGKLTSRGRLTPSLNGLRTFEAVARLGRVGLAAGELHVTHGAVSRQVRLLEEALGTALFSGPKHDQRLTPAGAALARRLTEGFEVIESAVGQLAGPAAALRIACHPSIAAKWMIPRLNGFTREHRELRLSLLDLAPDEIMGADAAASVRIVVGEAAQGFAVTPFSRNDIGLVCSAAVAQDIIRDGLDGVPRLVSQTRLQAFDEWAALAGRSAGPAETISFSHQHFMVEGAAAGAGVAIVPWLLVVDDVAAGRLVAPFGFVPAPGVFALIHPRGRRNPGLKAFEAWLVEEGGRSPPAPTSAS
jgi:LysR family glycine cleavage system transcriptional activator